MRTLLLVLVVNVLCGSVSFGKTPEREKMLIRFILQNEFTSELDRRLKGRNDLAEQLRSTPFASALSGISQNRDSTMRHLLVLDLGIPGYGDYDSVKVREGIKRALKAESGIWIRLEMARVLACLGDDAGKNVLLSALSSKDGYMTSSGIETSKAVLPLLLLDHEFPDGFPKRVQFCEWGGLKEYFQAVRAEHWKISLDDVRNLPLASLKRFWQGNEPEEKDEEPSYAVLSREMGCFGGKVWRAPNKEIRVWGFRSQDAAVAAMEHRVKNVAAVIERGEPGKFAGKWWYSKGDPCAIFVCHRNTILEITSGGSTYKDQAAFLGETARAVILLLDIKPRSPVEITPPFERQEASSAAKQ